jgi:hypothetical protein
VFVKPKLEYVEQVLQIFAWLISISAWF